MKKKIRFILPILFVVLVLGAGFYFWLYPTRGPHEAVDIQKAFLEEIEGTKVIHLKGTPYEMGFQRGVLLKDVIHRSLARFDELLELAKQEVGLPKFAAKLILDVTWRLCSPHIPLRYSRELEGIADGAGVNLQDLRRIHVVSVITERGCSSFAVWGKATVDGKMYHGRNFDWIMEAGIQDTAVTFCYEPQGLNSFISVGYACAIGVLSGMNNRKVSIAQIGATNKDRRIDGIPLEFLLRKILEEASTLDQVTEIVLEARHTVGYNYVIADGDENRALVYETCAHHVAIFTDNDPRETVEYAIPIENAVMRADEAMDPTIRSLQTCANAPNMPYGSNSYDHRYKGMATRIKENYGKIDQNIALEILKAVAMVNVNLHSVLYCPTDLELWVAHAKGKEDAAKQPYVHYKMKELFNSARKEKYHQQNQ
ncbi:MAG: C45 family autoproteolytic acyltransferase/hydrolase [Candidatus Hydrogenedens sp.]